MRERCSGTLHSQQESHEATHGPPGVEYATTTMMMNSELNIFLDAS